MKTETLEVTNIGISMFWCFGLVIVFQSFPECGHDFRDVLFWSLICRGGAWSALQNKLVEHKHPLVRDYALHMRFVWLWCASH